MSLEHWIVLAYLIGCVAVGAIAARRAQSSQDEYWVAGRSIGPWVNAIAIMAALASGGSIVGVMGLAYKLGIPATLALFAGAVVGFPLAALLIARPLRRFGKFTITDFLSFRYPSTIVQKGVPLLIVCAFIVYIVAQLKAAGVSAEVLLGIPYERALVISTVIFVGYVSFGGMLAITWTDVLQGAVMVGLVLATAAFFGLGEEGNALTTLESATAAHPALGSADLLSSWSYLGYFVIWATAISVVPHVVMRVYTAKDAQGAKLSLNLATALYALVILAAVMVIVPVGKLQFPGLEDPDTLFLVLMQENFSPLARGVAVAAVVAAVMSTTDALLLACSSAIAHDLLSEETKQRLGPRGLARVNIAVVWGVGIVALVLALRPPELLTILYTNAIGALSAGLFVPVVGGLWWKGARRRGGVAAFLTGVGTYLGLSFGAESLGLELPKAVEILFALPLSMLALVVASHGESEDEEVMKTLDSLHDAP